MKTIQLKEHGMGRYGDVSPFPIGDLEIELQNIPTYGGEFRFTAKNNGKICAQTAVTASQNRVTIPRDKLAAGRLSCFVSHYLKGEEVKRFSVEDLLIKDLNGDAYAFPEIAEMEQKISTLEKQAVIMSKTLKEEKEAREQAETEINSAIEYALSIALGLVRFAFEDYRENVYLHGGSFEDFLQEFGIDLTKIPEEKIKEIKGENENAEIE